MSIYTLRKKDSGLDNGWTASPYLIPLTDIFFFTSPEQKAQVSFSDRLLSVVCLSVCKLFTFSTSSPEPLDQFQPNLAQIILGLRGFKFVQMKGNALFQGEIIAKM